MTAAALHLPMSRLAWAGTLSHKLWVDLPAGTKPEPGHGALYGTQRLPRDIARWAHFVGWRDPLELAVAVCVCLCESQGYDHAIHVNYPNAQGVIYEDRGPWQLSSIHKIPDSVAYDLLASTREAYKLYVAAGRTFTDWVGFTHKIYLHDTYVERACAGVANFLGEELLSRPVSPISAGVPYEHRIKTPILDFRHRLAGAVEHLEAAQRKLGSQAAPKPRVTAVQRELAAGRQAAKAGLPLS